MTTKKNKTVEDQLYEADQIAWKALGCPEGTYDTTNVERLVARIKELQKAAKDFRDAASDLVKTEHPNQDMAVWFLHTLELLDEALAPFPPIEPTDNG